MRLVETLDRGERPCDTWPVLDASAAKRVARLATLD
jgi:hypothetical protein